MVRASPGANLSFVRCDGIAAKETKPFSTVMVRALLSLLRTSVLTKTSALLSLMLA